MQKGTVPHIRIPRAVAIDNRLSATSKLIFGFIILKAKKIGFCFCTNSYLQTVFNCSDRTIQRHLKELSELQLIKVSHIEQENGSFERRIFVAPPYDTNGTPDNNAPPDKIVLTPPDKIGDNNKNIRELEDIGLVTSVTKPAIAKRISNKKPAPKKEKIKDELWQRWVDSWHQFFQTRNDGRKPVWTEKQFCALKKIRQYLAENGKPRRGDPPDQPPEETGFKAWSYLLANWDLLDTWQKKQFNLALIHERISEFLNQLKSQKNGTANNGTAFTGGNGIEKPGISARKIQAAKDY